MTSPPPFFDFGAPSSEATSFDPPSSVAFGAALGAGLDCCDSTILEAAMAAAGPKMAPAAMPAERGSVTIFLITSVIEKPISSPARATSSSERPTNILMPP